MGAYNYRGGDSERMLDSQQGKVKDSERPVTGGHQTGFLHYMRFRRIQTITTKW